MTVDLERFTVLVGRNGSGKSSVLDALHLLSQVGIRRADERSSVERLGSIFGGPRSPARLASWGGAAPLTLAASSTSGDTLALTIENTGDKPRYLLEVRGEESLATQVPPPSGENELAVLNHPRVRAFGAVVRLRPDPGAMVRPWVSDRVVPRMGFDGAGLASTLAWLKGSQGERFAGLLDRVRRVIPAIRDLLVERAEVPRTRTVYVDGSDGVLLPRTVSEVAIGDTFAVAYETGRVPADLLSEGTVLTIGLLAKLEEEGAPRLLLLDDLERGLHVEAQSKLVGVLASLLTERPELQIVCTTHSPYLLDGFAPDQVRVLALDDRQETHACRLVDHPEYESWRFGLQTGELYAALGDAWAAGRGTAA